MITNKITIHYKTSDGRISYYYHEYTPDYHFSTRDIDRFLAYVGENKMICFDRYFGKGDGKFQEWIPASSIIHIINYRDIFNTQTGNPHPTLMKEKKRIF